MHNADSERVSCRPVVRRQPPRSSSSVLVLWQATAPPEEPSNDWLPRPMCLVGLAAVDGGDALSTASPVGVKSHVRVPAHPHLAAFLTGRPGRLAAPQPAESRRKPAPVQARHVGMVRTTRASG